MAPRGRMKESSRGKLVDAVLRHHWPVLHRALRFNRRRGRRDCARARLPGAAANAGRNSSARSSATSAAGRRHGSPGYSPPEKPRLNSAPPRILAFAGAFHGNSLGARCLRGGERSLLYRPMTRIERIELPLSGYTDIEALLAQHELRLPALTEDHGLISETDVVFSTIIAAIYEPLLGEGGVLDPPANIVEQLQNRDFPLIADEIQCGLGRTGTFLASQGIHRDYYLFAKSLGGSLAKISATLIERSRYVERFDEHYSTTFSGDAFSCTVASATLRCCNASKLRCARHPWRRHQAATDAARRRTTPPVIRAITAAASCSASTFSLRSATTCSASGCLPHTNPRHRHCILPAQSPQPALAAHAYRNEHAARRSQHLHHRRGHRSAHPRPRSFLPRAADARTPPRCSTVSSKKNCNLPGAQRGEPNIPRFSCALEAPAPGARRVAFLGHFVSPERDIVMLEPALGALSRSARRVLLQKVSRLRT